MFQFHQQTTLNLIFFSYFDTFLTQDYFFFSAALHLGSIRAFYFDFI